MELVVLKGLNWDLSPMSDDVKCLDADVHADSA